MAPDVPDDPMTLEPARAACAGCPVQQRCHSTAMAVKDFRGASGGGFTAKERQQMLGAVA